MIPSARVLVLSIGLWAPLLLAQSSSSDLTQQYYEAGQKALLQSHYDEAEKAYEKLRELQPGMAEVHANLGLIYFQERKFEQAVPTLRQALKLKPTLPKAGNLLAMSLSELGRYGEALPGLEKCFRLSTDPIARRMCGLQLLRAYTGVRRDSKAVEVALEMDRLYPNDPEVLYHNGKVFGNFAFLDMQRLARAAPTSIWKHQAEAEADESQGYNDAAISGYREVLAADPRRPGIHYRLGRTLLARSRQNGSAEDGLAAQKEFEQEVLLDPSNASAAYEVGEAHRNAGELDDAQRAFEQALKFYPDFEDAHLGLASVLMSQKSPELALPHLQKAIQLNAGNEVAWYRLSQAEGTLGHAPEKQKAFAEFQRLRNLKSVSEGGGRQIFSPEEITRQTIDTKNAQ